MGVIKLIKAWLSNPARWRRKQKSPIVWSDKDEDPFEHLDTTYMTSSALLEYKDRQYKKLLKRCGADFIYCINGFFYQASKRTPIADSHANIYEYESTSHNRCTPDKMPELSHLRDMLCRVAQIIERREDIRDPKEGDTIFVGIKGGGFFAKIVKMFPDKRGYDFMKMSPLYGNKKNPDGWICGQELEYAYIHNTPPVLEREAPQYT